MPWCAVDLFCGIGGLTKGLENAGIEVIAGIDIDASCEYAYNENNCSKFINADVTALKGGEISNLYPIDCTKILVGCAPCQPFSKYSSKYRKDGWKDEKWKLVYSFLRLIKEVKPTVISMENVPGLAKQKIFTDFLISLKKMGYHVDWEIVYCPQYGVPQKRKRLVLLGSVLGDIHLIPPFLDEKHYLTVRDAIGSLSPIKNGEKDPFDLMHCSSKLSKLNLRRIKESIPGGTWREWDTSLLLNCHSKSSGKTFPSVYGRMCWDEPAPTITTQFFGYGNGRFGHPEQDRALSLREGALLQSFPPNYKFIDPNKKMSKREIAMHIGNAVPVKLGEAIGISIVNHLKLHMKS